MNRADVVAASLVVVRTVLAIVRGAAGRLLLAVEMLSAAADRAAAGCVCTYPTLKTVATAAVLSATSCRLMRRATAPSPHSEPLPGNSGRIMPAIGRTSVKCV